MNDGTRGKLIYVINHIDWFWSHRLPLAQGAQKDKWDVHVAVPDASKDEKLQQNGFTGHDLPPARGFLPFVVLRTIWSIHQLIKRENPTALHAITLKYAFMAGLAARFHKDVKVIHTIAGLGFLFSGEGFKPAMLRFIVGPFLKFALKHPRAQIIFQNPDDESLMIRCGFVRNAQCHLIKGSGVDLEQFPFTAEKPSDPPIVLLPTRLVHDKGISVFIETAKRLEEQGIDADFQIAGGITTSNPWAITQEEMDEMLQGSKVKWLGKVDDMPALYKAASLILYPSYYGEGVPKVLLEASAIGRAIITTDHPGCREAVDEGKNGLLVPIKDVDATVEAVSKLIKDPKTRESMGAESRKRAEEVFDVKLIVKSTLGVYKAASVS